MSDITSRRSNISFARISFPANDKGSRENYSIAREKTNSQDIVLWKLFYNFEDQDSRRE